MNMNYIENLVEEINMNLEDHIEENEYDFGFGEQELYNYVVNFIENKFDDEDEMYEAAYLIMNRIR